MSAFFRIGKQVFDSVKKKAKVVSNKTNTQSAALIINRKLVDKTSVVIVYKDDGDSFKYTCIFRNKPKNKRYDTLYVSAWTNLSLNLKKNISKSTLLNRIEARIVGKRKSYPELLAHLKIGNPNLDKLKMILKPLKMSENRKDVKRNTNDIDDLQLYGKKSFFNYPNDMKYGTIHLYANDVESKKNKLILIKNNNNNTPMALNKQRADLTNKQKQNAIRANQILNIQIKQFENWYKTSQERNKFPIYPLFR